MGCADKFWLPAKGAKAERASFKYQASRHKHGVKVDYSQEDVDLIAAQYPRGKVNKVFDTLSEEDFNMALEEVLQDVPRDSTPGYPMNMRCRNMGDLFDDDSALTWLYEQGFKLFTFLVSNDITGWTADQIYRELGIVDHLFIKDEIHPLEKVLQQRFRIIFSVPILFNLMERLCCSQQNKIEIRNWKDIASKIGIGFTDDMAADVAKYVEKMKLVNSTDMSGWDWTVIGDLIKFDCRVRLKLAEGCPGYANFERFLNNVNTILLRKVVALSDGTLLAQNFDGVIPSGSYRTSSTNSRIRLIARYLSFRDLLAATVGDDCLEGDYGNIDPVEAYWKLGLILKETSACDATDFEFCSKRFTNGKARPVDPMKLLLRYYVTGGYNYPQIYSSIFDELRHCDQAVKDLLKQNGEIMG